MLSSVYLHQDTAVPASSEHYAMFSTVVPALSEHYAMFSTSTGVVLISCDSPCISRCYTNPWFSKNVIRRLLTEKYVFKNCGNHVCTEQVYDQFHTRSKHENDVKSSVIKRRSIYSILRKAPPCQTTTLLQSRGVSSEKNKYLYYEVVSSNRDWNHSSVTKHEFLKSHSHGGKVVPNNSSKCLALSLYDTTVLLHNSQFSFMTTKSILNVFGREPKICPRGERLANK